MNDMRLIERAVDMNDSKISARNVQVHYGARMRSRT
jgi:phosphate transport system ATP-binding protein